MLQLIDNLQILTAEVALGRVAKFQKLSEYHLPKHEAIQIVLGNEGRMSIGIHGVDEQSGSQTPDIVIS